MIIPAYHIMTLDEAVKTHPHARGHSMISLHQAVMALKSTEFLDLNLFQSLGHNTSTGRIFFVCYSKLESETQAVVPILALITETKFGPRVWR